MYRMGKAFKFSASHRLDYLPEDHKCHRLHGHNYVVELILESDDLDDNNFIVDYGDLAPFKQFIADDVDHRDLNEVLFPMRTTAENLARWFWEYIRMQWPAWPLACVRVSETDNTFAEYSLK